MLEDSADDLRVPDVVARNPSPFVCAAKPLRGPTAGAGRNVVRRSTIDRSARVTFPLVSRVALQSVRDANLLGGPSRQPPGLTPYSLR
jgi:hypothetical protein